MDINVREEMNAQSDFTKNQLGRRSQPKTLSSSITLGSSSEEGGLALGQMLEAIKRRSLIILGITTVMIGATIISNRTRPPSFMGSFEILIEPATVESVVVSSLGKKGADIEHEAGASGNSSIALDYPTQIQILRSPKLLKPIVDTVQNNTPDFSYATLSNSLEIDRLKDNTDTKILKVNYQSKSYGEAEKVTNLIAKTYLNYSVSQRQTNVRRAIQFVEMQLQIVQKQVVKIEATLQKFRELNQLIDPTAFGTYISTLINANQQELITTQIELAQARQLYSVLEKQQLLQPNSSEAASVLSDAPDYRQLVRQLQELDVEIQAKSTELTGNHPSVVALREKRATLLPLLQQKAVSTLGKSLSQKVDNLQSLPYQNALRQDLSKQFINSSIQIQVLESKLSSIKSARKSLLSQNEKLPLIVRQYNDLQRRLQVATDQLNQFLQKREELKISSARQEVPWELLKPPIIEQIPTSSLLRDIVLGTILGLLLGIGVALLIDKSYNIIYSLEDLSSEIKMPILGIIPFEKNLNPRSTIYSFREYDNEISKYQFSCFLESFRSLYSQIRILNPDSPIHSLVISSVEPNEGKTTIAFQLAQAAAAMGRRVLLVDADLRNPTLNEFFDQISTLGLTDVVTGDMSVKQVVQSIPQNPNLFVLFAGMIPADPTSLLASIKMKELMEECYSNFDLVIYDSPPLSFADPLLLVSETDGLLFVACLGKTSRRLLQSSLRVLETAKVHFLGMSINRGNSNYSTYMKKT